MRYEGPAIANSQMLQSVTTTAHSRETALACFSSLCAWHGISLDASRQLGGQVEFFSAEQLVAIIHDEGFTAALVKLQWRSLLTETFKSPVILLLKNGNFVLSMDKGRGGREEIVISDPLHQNGKKCFLPRATLENAWAGIALIAQPQRTRIDRVVARVLRGLSACFVFAGVFFLVAGAIKAKTDFPQDIDYAVPIGQAPVQRQERHVQHPSGRASVQYVESPQPTPVAPASAVSELQVTNGGSGRTPESSAGSPYQPSTLQERTEPSAGSADATVVTTLVTDPESSRRSGAGNGPVRLEPIEVLDDAETVTLAEERLHIAAAGGESVESVPKEDFKLAPAETAGLVSRGDYLLAKGDVTAARLFYERAAYAQDPQAALRLAETYDRGFLARVRSTGVRGNTFLAIRWYRRASELGAAGAEVLLKALFAAEDPGEMNRR